MKYIRTHLIFYFIIIQVGCLNSAHSQSNGTILVISSADAKVVIDGDEIGTLNANKPGKFEVSEGQHYLQVIPINSNEEKNEILDIKSGKQLVLKYEFGDGLNEANVDNRILIADIDFNIPGVITANAKDGFEYPTFLYAFEKGDKIVINLSMTNAKGTNVIHVSTYPDGNMKYTNDSFQKLEEVIVHVEQRSIYVFSFASNHAFDRDAKLTIARVPASIATKNFTTAVSWKETYRVETIQKPQHFYINSGNNAIFQNGKSRIVLPVNFPENTIKWYFEFSASRDEEEIKSISNVLSLASELSTLIDQTGILSFGIDLLTQPPGSNYCDIYLLDHSNSSLFTSKERFTYYTEGTRENIKSGVVEVGCCINLPTYLGIKNPSNFHGVHVAIEVAAIIKEEGWTINETSEK